MSDEIEVLKVVSRRLDEASIPYMLTGSMAMNYYAQPRMTRDIDVVVALRPSDAGRLTALFESDFLCEKEAVLQGARERGMFNIIHTTLIIKIDFVVRKDSPYRIAEFERRRAVTIDGQTIAIVAPEDLLLSKLDWARETRSQRQLGDARNLISSVDELDWEYLEHWAREIDVAALLSEVRS